MLYNRIQIYFIPLSLLWIANDSIFKVCYPGAITGKISDLIGILLTPLILTGIISLFVSRTKLNLIFWISLLLTNLLFITINISQTTNESFYSLIGSNENRNLADRSDLFVLPLSFLTFYLSKQIKAYFRIQFHQKILNLILPTLALINTSYPSGRSDSLSILLLLDSASNKIIQLDPKGENITANSYTFRFQFIGKNHESSPRSFEIPNPSSDCPSTVEPTKDLGNTKTSFPESGKFQNYRIDISKSQNFESIDKTTDCSETTCTIDLQDLDSGNYYWKVRVRYLYRLKCQLYLENFIVPQEVQHFTK